ncbi:holo-ACP synthase ['Catharanthus roseus' aster yellows phytoplasma]|uniref:Holo-[acyl-carrier-protein] synthase n=1 Tax='Catharanthus roseus' aster yellows phytoplasma TaxID=1193712 RepID=A0A4P6M8Y3_9MOLU|nr:holo-ACP synthase ['Catharanthus roseus' aster yellows phytoplasma]QBF23842.1 holo-[acyl-carrier-protein] synthase ['Catharanthus roseus' aster yellows phytoplasma]
MENIGIDLVEIKKIKKIGKDILAARILSSEEYQIYQIIQNPQSQLTFLAGRWASKEALFKAFQTPQKIDPTCQNYYNWSILNDKNGAPYVKNNTCTTFFNPILISITHTDNYALALVILKKLPQSTS